MKTTVTHERSTETAALVAKVQQLLASRSVTDTGEIVSEVLTPQEMEEVLGELPAGSHGEGGFLEAVEQTLKYSLDTSKPLFLSQQYSRSDAGGVVSEYLAAELNTNVHTYMVSPVFTVMEKKLVRKMCELIGWENGDGLFNPGGSMSNQMAMCLARDHAYPDAKKSGMVGQLPPAIFTSHHTHYSFMKGCMFLGFGQDALIYVDSNEAGQIDADKLEAAVQRAIAAGRKPMMVAGVAGSTVLGAFDDIPALHEVCQRHNMWLHVDGCWGGSMLLSERYKKQLLNGVELCDSFAWNAHKMIAMPLQCALLLVKKAGVLEASFATRSSYLFHGDALAGRHNYDLAEKSVQCGRKSDSLKLWLAWKWSGDAGLAAHVEKIMGTHAYLRAAVKKRDHFQLVLEHPACINVCFWFKHPHLSTLPADAQKEELAKLTRATQKAMLADRRALLNFQPLKGKADFFRVTVTNFALSHDDCDSLLDVVEQVGMQVGQQWIADGTWA